MATRNKFRVSEIELQYPVTFKMEVGDLQTIVNEWMDLNGFSTDPLELKEIGHDQDQDPHIYGYSYSFSNFDFKTLFGMANDIHIRVIE